MKKTPGVDINTGSLGLGASEAIGMALEGKMTHRDFHVFAVLGDGELNEGIVWEAVMSANKYKLDNLTYFVDYNHLQIDGTTEEVMPLEPLAMKFESFGWQVLNIDGHSIEEILSAVGKEDGNERQSCLYYRPDRERAKGSVLWRMNGGGTARPQMKNSTCKR